ncbi:hypothetical protein [Pseudoteredinibacter isoporae]|uniref:Uncharacterized protein n=1 Tax=Pseudoteredinibacter isoporae TaxID=570281 RepID=A0A7X0JSM8_9GAMM|nr:hypothetical protein [Pseudoteredinibacter isoporae]MBB6521555.1 hypothetical protein [Pseudoteredinibacter isoporae]NHO87109.1 hypothetical protein [Pseudoteredinibacter isoporae]NIB22933.1 hypothetical protein [Pseudoteredinibacter isoporae]
MGNLYIYIKSSVEWLVMEHDNIVSSGCLNMAQSSINKNQSQPLQALLPKEFANLPCHVIIAAEHSISLAAELDCPERHARSASLYALQEHCSQPSDSLHWHFHSYQGSHIIEAINKDLFNNIYLSLEGLALVDVRFDYQLMPCDTKTAEALCLGQRLLLRLPQVNENEFSRHAYSVHKSWAKTWWKSFSESPQLGRLKLYGCIEEFTACFSEKEKMALKERSVDLDLCEPCAAADLEQLLCYQQHRRVNCNGKGNLLSAIHPATANTYRLSRPTKPILIGAYTLLAASAMYWGSQLLT